MAEKKQKMPKVTSKGFIRIKVINKNQLINEKDKTIRVCEADGTDIAIQDGAEVVVSEYVYNSLKDATEPIYVHVKKDPSKDMRESPAELKIVGYHANYDVTELSDWMETRDPKDAPVTKIKAKEILKQAAATA